MKKTIRMGDLLSPDSLTQKLKDIMEWKNLTINGGYNHEKITAEAMVEWIEAYGMPFKDYITNTTKYLSGAVKEGKNII